MTWHVPYNTVFATHGENARLITRRALELEGYDEDLV
jgi:hypothetical protein